MECFKIENVSFCYPNRSKNALENINLAIKQGEFVLLCGKSGCGKTTLLRLLKSSLSPFGRTSGAIWFRGEPLSSVDAKAQAENIGFVMQSPDNQIVTDKVWHELAFGLESLGVNQNEIRARVSEMASFFGIENWFYKDVNELSGGQKQLLNLASVMVMQPSVLILDEPTSQLDPIAAGEFLKTLRKINLELGTTILLTEHRLEEAFPISDRVIVMDEGKILADEMPENIGKILKEKNHDMYQALPTPLRVHGEIPNALPCPLTVKDGRIWLAHYAEEHPLNPDAIPKDIQTERTETVIEVKNAWFRYEKESPDVIKGLHVSAKKGELFCLLGGNGTGKTTALSLIAGLNAPYRGDVFIKGQRISKIKHLYRGPLGALPQNPQSVFSEKTVFLDLLENLSEQKLSKEEKRKKVYDIATLCRIQHLLDVHPYDLSGGEQQRAALAKILLAEPEILLLDEPTKGMDAAFKEEFAEILNDLKQKGITVFMVSHDIEFCAKYADRCALMFDGALTSIGAPREFFKGKNYYTTAANRMARTLLPDAVLAEDILSACGKTTKNQEKSTLKTNLHKPEQPTPPKDCSTCASHTPSPKKHSKRTWMTSLLLLLLIPLTIFIGNSFFGDRKYFFISLLIILETMIPFFMAFEGRKPKARELVVISVLCALSVIGRAAFFMIPQFKPVIALVIISGICFGGETGFLVGSVSGFVSNFFFGQGPWAPWQMFAFGIIGFLAGVLFQKGLFRKKRLTLCIFGFLMAFFVYGGILNPASVLMWQNKITWEMLFAAFLAGFPFDLIHALATCFFLWVLSMPMIEKLERIKIKYGFVR